MMVANRILQEFFGELDRQGVGYCLLRGFDELAELRSVQEVDLLVRPEDRWLFIQAASSLGLRDWPAWGHAPHRFFLFYDAAEDSWVKLDMVTTLRYGAPIRCLEVDLTNTCLLRRRRDGPTWIPSPEDEMLALLLHCILDKKRFREAHRTRLASLWREVREAPDRYLRLVYLLELHVGPYARSVIEISLGSGDWHSMQELRDDLARAFFHRRPAQTAWRFVTTWCLRRLRRLLLLTRRHAVGTVLLAPDGGGKSTLATALMHDPFIRARVVYMGANAAEARAMHLPLSAWLQRQLREGGGFPRRQVIGLLYTIHRLLEEWARLGIGELQRLQGRFVVYDRYWYDTYLSPRASSWRLRLRRSLLARTAPAPDLVLLLDAPGDVLHARKGEHTPEFLEAQRQVLHTVVSRVPQSATLDATRGADAVRRMAVALIWKRYCSTGGGSGDDVTEQENAVQPGEDHAAANRPLKGAAG
jgi:thymidylate kinase